MLYHPGPNPTVDCIVKKKMGNDPINDFKILFIRRSKYAQAEPGKWAFPGGFIDTKASKGESWIPGLETEIAAVKRELKEESGLDLTHYSEDRFRLLAVSDKLERDPRNTPTHWIENHVFTVEIQEDESEDVVELDVLTGSRTEETEEVCWFSFQSLRDMKKEQFAFDHYDILKEHFIV